MAVYENDLVNDPQKYHLTQELVNIRKLFGVHFFLCHQFIYLN